MQGSPNSRAMTIVVGGDTDVADRVGERCIFRAIGREGTTGIIFKKLRKKMKKKLKEIMRLKNKKIGG